MVDEHEEVITEPQPVDELDPNTNGSAAAEEGGYMHLDENAKLIYKSAEAQVSGRRCVVTITVQCEGARPEDIEDSIMKAAHQISSNMPEGTTLRQYLDTIREELLQDALSCINDAVSHEVERLTDPEFRRKSAARRLAAKAREALQGLLGGEEAPEIKVVDRAEYDAAKDVSVEAAEEAIASHQSSCPEA